MSNAGYFQSVFLAQCVTKTDIEWQRFVTQLMQARHGGRFVQVDPSFSGDLGCDGYIEGLMLACYGGLRPTQKYVTHKINTDFSKAKKYWVGRMTRWAFVHNGVNGLPLMAAQAFVALQLSESGNGLSVEQWPPQTLWQETLLGLVDELLIPILGIPPSQRPAEMSYIAEAIRHMARAPLTSGTGPILPVPEKKIEYNDFSAPTRDLIREFQVHTHLVRYYFDNTNPGEQFQVSINLRARYDALRAKYRNPDVVFHALCEELILEAFSADQNKDIAKQRNAAILIVTHFFESCLIFEMPGEGA